ncbi:hypothetical protein H2203_007973 [Taxawa tesnikishii (nom. ined.)]|nr:hypothetical protein H2203_007973 [Dothideales sp. JES 119]
MRSQSILALAAILMTATALPNATPTSSKTSSKISSKTSSQHSSTSTHSTTSSKTSVAASATPTINNGQVFVNQCNNSGVSIADCTELLNIAALNGNQVVIGGTTTSAAAGSVNNGQLFLNQCQNSGISVLDCAELLNIALLNGNQIDISLGAIESLLALVGLPTQLLGGLLGTATSKLIAIPTGVL